jgi:hypothetical protein
MKLHIPDRDFPFVADTFALAIQQTHDGERITREQAQAELDRQLAEEAQLAIPLEITSTA